MRFLGKVLTFILKFIFFTMFVLGVFLVSILHTYLDKDYYKEHFAEQFIELQADHIIDAIEEKTSSLPIELGKEQIREILGNILTEDIINATFDTVFEAIETYTGDTITIDLSHFKQKEDDFIENLVDANLKALPEAMPDKALPISTLRKETERLLRHTIDFGIPAVINLEVKNSETARSLRIIQFVLTNKSLITWIIFALMAIPLIGILGMNLHPIHRGLRQVATSLMAGGFIVAILEFLFGLVVGLGGNAVEKSALKEAGVNVDAVQVQEIAGFLFDKIFEITTFVGLITLGSGMLLLALSMYIQRRYGYRR